MRWALIVAGLYGLILLVLTVPITWVAFLPQFHITEDWRVYTVYPYWLWIGVMVLSQLALLIVPVSVANRRPVTRRSLLWPVIVAGLMMGCMAVGAISAIYEFIMKDPLPDAWLVLAAIVFGVLLWLVWAIVFFRMSRNANPMDVVTRQCRLLFKGSILELLIAVPTHIVARYRDYCCAGFMTFIGLALGISVMLFSFGPGVFFLYVDRWRRLHPTPEDETRA